MLKRAGIVAIWKELRDLAWMSVFCFLPLKVLKRNSKSDCNAYVGFLLEKYSGIAAYKRQLFAAPLLRPPALIQLIAVADGGRIIS